MTQIPDSVSADVLRRLAGFSALAHSATIKDVQYGDIDSFEGLFDFYMLICLAIDGPEGGSPNPVQITAAASGLVAGLIAHMENCVQQIETDNSNPAAQKILDQVGPEQAAAIRKGALAQANQDLTAIRQAWRQLEALKGRMVRDALVNQCIKRRCPPSSCMNDQAFVSDRFLASIGLTREEFDACVERPVGL